MKVLIMSSMQQPLKQVPACEYNPNRSVKTNIHGAMNIIEAALDAPM